METSSRWPEEHREAIRLAEVAAVAEIEGRDGRFYVVFQWDLDTTAFEVSLEQIEALQTQAGAVIAGEGDQSPYPFCRKCHGRLSWTPPVSGTLLRGHWGHSIADLDTHPPEPSWNVSEEVMVW